MAISPYPSKRHAFGKVLQGKDDWLFVHRDTNLVMAQHTGELMFNRNQLTQWRLVLETRQAWLERKGIHYFLLMPPSTASIYPEFLPDEFESTGRRPVHQLLDHLDESGVTVPRLYPEAEIRALKEREPHQAPFVRNESHWMDAAAFRAYELVLDRLPPEVPVRRLRPADLNVVSHPVIGDLGRQVDPPLEDMHHFMHVREPRARLVEDNRVYNRGRIIVYECDDAPGTCVMQTDSSGYWLAPFMAETFGRFVFVHRFTMDFELLEAEQPDLFLNVHTERCLIRVPVDQPFEPTRALVRRKRKSGDVLAPRAPQLRPDIWPPLNYSGD